MIMPAEEKNLRIHEIRFQLRYVDQALPYTSPFREDYNELANQPLLDLSNEQLHVIGERVAELQGLVRKTKVQP